MRKSAGFESARAFAKRLGIDENRYKRYERAEVEPNLDLLVKISRELSVSIDTLVGLEPEQALKPASASRPRSRAGCRQGSMVVPRAYQTRRAE